MRLLAISIALALVALAAPAGASAQGQILILGPFCDTHLGTQASGFLISATRTDITVRVTSEFGNFNGTVFTIVPGLGIGATGSPGIGRTTFEVFEDPNGSGTIDPGELLLETILAPDPCAPPAPTSKDQCKGNGYAGFGFRNQGQCVASVQGGPKP
jgi:hypothetical protein